MSSGLFLSFMLLIACLHSTPEEEEEVPIIVSEVVCDDYKSQVPQRQPVSCFRSGEFFSCTFTEDTELVYSYNITFGE